MSNTLLLKSNQAGDVPDAGSDVLVGEIALDTYNGEIYMGKKQGGDPGDDSTHIASPLMKTGGAMSGNIALGSEYISGDGGDEGMTIDASGNAAFTGNIDIPQNKSVYLGPYTRIDAIDANGTFRVNTYNGSSWNTHLSILANSNATFGGKAFFQDGAVGAPGIAFADDTDTGIYRNTVDTMAFVTGGGHAFALFANQSAYFYGAVTNLGSHTMIAPTSDMHAATRIYVDETVKFYSTGTTPTSCSVANTWYVGKSAMGTGSVPTVAEFDSNLLKQDAHYFCTPHAIEVKAIGFNGATNYANSWQVQFWRVRFADLDTVATVSQVGSTIAFTGSTSAMYNKLQTGLSITLNANDCIFTSVRFLTGGATKKLVYSNTVIQYHNL